MKIHFALMLVTVATVSGCASRAHCVGDYDYQHAYSLQKPELEGLKMPTSSAAMVIPAPVNQMVPYAYKAPEGSKDAKNGMQCLDTPPRLTVTANKS